MNIITFRDSLLILNIRKMIIDAILWLERIFSPFLKIFINSLHCYKQIKILSNSFIITVQALFSPLMEESHLKQISLYSKIYLQPSNRTVLKLIMIIWLKGNSKLTPFRHRNITLNLSYLTMAFFPQTFWPISELIVLVLLDSLVCTKKAIFSLMLKIRTLFLFNAFLKKIFLRFLVQIYI